VFLKTVDIVLSWPAKNGKISQAENVKPAIFPKACQRMLKSVCKEKNIIYCLSLYVSRMPWTILLMKWITDRWCGACIKYLFLC